MRSEYALRLSVNGRITVRVIIDSHYREKRSDLNDWLILRLLKNLNGKSFPIEGIRNGYEFFRAEPIYFSGKPYRLILVWNPVDDFLGVVNVFRIDME